MFSRAVWREGRCKQITLACARSVSATLGLPPLTVHTAQALGCSTRNRLRPALGCMHLPGLSRSGSGTQVVPRGADSVGPAFLCPSQVRVARVFGERGRCDSSPLPSLRLGFLGVQLAHLLRRMVTVQNPRKSSWQRSLLTVWEIMSLWSCDCPLPALAACHRRGMVCSGLACSVLRSVGGLMVS